ncbi:MAG: hypothetical protein IJ087_22625, partial [Eggerthellaceae bacterium]|nr:hypothetical protein [Eggerthellaceae bacterium]
MSLEATRHKVLRLGGLAVRCRPTGHAWDGRTCAQEAVAARVAATCLPEKATPQVRRGPSG